MNRRYCFSLASVLGFICLVCIFGLVANAFDIISFEKNVKNISVIIGIISSFGSVFFCGLGFQNNHKANKLMSRYLFVLFILYFILLVDFTLLDNNYGRNILSVFDPDRSSFRRYLKECTNFVPFATIKLFIKGYINNNLSLGDTVVNLFGNFTFFMPVPFFVCVFKKGKINFLKMLVFLFLCITVVEFLQVVFMTGSCDIDDLILNLSGAALFYFIICRRSVSDMLSKLTFGVWK